MFFFPSQRQYHPWLIEEPFSDSITECTAVGLERRALLRSAECFDSSSHSCNIIAVGVFFSSFINGRHLLHSYHSRKRSDWYPRCPNVDLRWHSPIGWSISSFQQHVHSEHLPVHHRLSDLFWRLFHSEIPRKREFIRTESVYARLVYVCIGGDWDAILIYHILDSSMLCCGLSSGDVLQEKSMVRHMFHYTMVVPMFDLPAVCLPRATSKCWLSVPLTDPKSTVRRVVWLTYES